MKLFQAAKQYQSQAIYSFLRLRTTLFTLESFLIPLADFVATQKRPRLPFDDMSLFIEVRKSLDELLKNDADRIKRKIYPAKVLLAGDPIFSPFSHLMRLPKIFQDSMRAAKSRSRKETKVFSDEASAQKENLPSYYQRNFHFQKDGYLSRESAELYEHQVELLFVGAADAMRRMAIEPLKKQLKNIREPKILEIGCGAGSTTQFIQMAFPKAKITAVDLSEPYLQLAKEKLSGIEFKQARGEKLPFKAGEFDAVVTVFLFHELPKEIRFQVLKQARNVLKKNGIFVFVDALQLGDTPKFDSILKRFPVDFHEPFFTNYIKNPMNDLLHEAKLRPIDEELGLFSKMISAKRA